MPPVEQRRRRGPYRALLSLIDSLKEGDPDRSTLPPALIEAERTFLLAQALPGYTSAEIEAMPAADLDWIIRVASAYRGVYSH